MFPRTTNPLLSWVHTDSAGIILNKHRSGLNKFGSFSRSRTKARMLFFRLIPWTFSVAFPFVTARSGSLLWRHATLHTSRGRASLATWRSPVTFIATKLATLGSPSRLNHFDGVWLASLISFATCRSEWIWKTTFWKRSRIGVFGRPAFLLVVVICRALEISSTSRSSTALSISLTI